MKPITYTEAMTAIEDINKSYPEKALIENVAELTGKQCELVAVSKVKTAAAHKDLDIYKVSKSQVILPESGETYVNMVKESAKALGSDESNIDSYTAGDTYYKHTDVYPICESKKDASKKYLYCIYEASTMPVYVLNGEELSKEQVAEYLTPAESKKLLGDKETVTENKTAGISHNVTVRTISLSNVADLTSV